MDEKQKLRKSEIARDIRSELAKAASTDVKLKLALSKIASLQHENEVYITVLKLVRDGVIDAFEGLDKAAEFISSKDKMETVKQAHETGINIEIFESLVSDPLKSKDNEDTAKSAEENFKAKLQNFVDNQ